MLATLFYQWSFLVQALTQEMNPWPLANDATASTLKPWPVITMSTETIWWAIEMGIVKTSAKSETWEMNKDKVKSLTFWVLLRCSKCCLAALSTQAHPSSCFDSLTALACWIRFSMVVGMGKSEMDFIWDSSLTLLLCAAFCLSFMISGDGWKRVFYNHFLLFISKQRSEFLPLMVLLRFSYHLLPRHDQRDDMSLGVIRTHDSIPDSDPGRMLYQLSFSATDRLSIYNIGSLFFHEAIFYILFLFPRMHKQN